VTGENWHQERDRLVQLLGDVESGKITHIDHADLRELQPTSPNSIDLLKKRLAKLNGFLS